MINLIHGECLEEMAKLEANSVDLVLADIPYGTTACKWDTVLDLKKMWIHLKRMARIDSAIVLFGNQPFTSTLIMSNPREFKYMWIWDKIRGSNFATVKKRPFNSHEDICVFYARQPTYNPQMWQGKPYIQKQGYVGEAKQTGLHRKEVISKSDGERYPLSIIKVSKESGFHTTQKPVALMEYLIKTYSNSGDTVLDFTMGSGTTGVACKQLNRNFIGIELDQEYFNIAKPRIEGTECHIVTE